MSIEKLPSQPDETLDLFKLPEYIREIAIWNLENSLSEEYKEPTTDLEKIQDWLYQKELQNQYTGDEQRLISEKRYLDPALIYENYGYPPGNTPINQLKTFIRKTTNFSTERRCWELLKQHHELAELKGCQTLKEEVDYENFLEQYCSHFEIFDAFISSHIPANTFSRLFSKHIIELKTQLPEVKELQETLDLYTQNGDLLHPEGIKRDREQAPEGFTPTQEELNYLFKRRIKKEAREILRDLIYPIE